MDSPPQMYMEQFPTALVSRRKDIGNRFRSALRILGGTLQQPRRVSLEILPDLETSHMRVHE